MTVKNNHVASSWHIVRHLVFAVGSREHHPRKFLPVVQVVTLVIRYRLVRAAHARYKSPVVAVAYTLIAARRNVESLTTRLVIHLPSVLRSRCAVVRENVAPPSHKPSVLHLLLHMRNLARSAAQVDVAANAAQLPYLQLVEDCLAPHHKVGHAERKLSVHAFREAEASLQQRVKVLALQSLQHHVAEQGIAAPSVNMGRVCLVAPRTEECVATQLCVATRRQLVRLRVALAVHVSAAHAFLVRSCRQTFLETYESFSCIVLGLREKMLAAFALHDAARLRYRQTTS